MGVPALKIQHESRHARPALRIVRRGACTKRQRRPHADVGKEMFTLACVILAGLALFGLGRVMLASRATEASIRSSALREEIKAEQLAGDLLEIDKSSLAVPSRIENIAGNSMQMSEAVSVEYMELSLDTESESVADAGSAAETNASQAVPAEDDQPGVLASVLEMAAGEAQVLLVGDVGLASSE